MLLPRAHLVVSCTHVPTKLVGTHRAWHAGTATVWNPAEQGSAALEEARDKYVQSGDADMKRMHGAGGACAHSQQKLLEIEPVDSALRTSGLLPPSTLQCTWAQGPTLQCSPSCHEACAYTCMHACILHVHMCTAQCHSARLVQPQRCV
jgi:hypothetical protein